MALGEEITIRRGGRPVAKLVPVDQPPTHQFGYDEGRFEVPDDFDAPLPDEVLPTFET